MPGRSGQYHPLVAFASLLFFGLEANRFGSPLSFLVFFHPPSVTRSERVSPIVILLRLELWSEIHTKVIPGMVSHKVRL